MEPRDWITIGVAAVTILNGWLQFWVKERFFAKSDSATDHVIAIFKSRAGISFIAFTGITSVVSVWLLVLEVLSDEPLSRLSAFLISGLTVLAVLNAVLVQSLFTLRRLAVLRQEIKDAESRAKAFAFFLS